MYGSGELKRRSPFGRKAIECASESFEPLILRWYGPYEDFLFAHIAQCLWLLYALVFLLWRGHLLSTWPIRLRKW
jgi:hypothetical protein